MSNSDTHPHIMESLKNLIDLYEAWNKPEKAKQWRKKQRGKMNGQSLKFSIS